MKKNLAEPVKPKVLVTLRIIIFNGVLLRQEISVRDLQKSNSQIPVKSTRSSVRIRGISWLRSAFIFLRWFKLAHIYIQICTLHNGGKQGIDQQIFNFSGSPPWAVNWKKRQIGKKRREPNKRQGCYTAVAYCLCLKNYTCAQNPHIWSCYGNN